MNINKSIKKIEIILIYGAKKLFTILSLVLIFILNGCSQIKEEKIVEADQSFESYEARPILTLYNLYAREGNLAFDTIYLPGSGLNLKEYNKLVQNNTIPDFIKLYFHGANFSIDPFLIFSYAMLSNIRKRDEVINFDKLKILQENNIITERLRKEIIDLNYKHRDKPLEELFIIYKYIFLRENFLYSNHSRRIFANNLNLLGYKGKDGAIPIEEFVNGTISPTELLDKIHGIYHIPNDTFYTDIKVFEKDIQEYIRKIFPKINSLSLIQLPTENNYEIAYNITYKVKNKTINNIEIIDIDKNGNFLCSDFYQLTFARLCNQISKDYNMNNFFQTKKDNTILNCYHKYFKRNKIFKGLFIFQSDEYNSKIKKSKIGFISNWNLSNAEITYCPYLFDNYLSNSQKKKY